MILLKPTQEKTLMNTSNFFPKKDKTIIFTPIKEGKTFNTQNIIQNKDSKTLSDEQSKFNLNSAKNGVRSNGARHVMSSQSMRTCTSFQSMDPQTKTSKRTSKRGILITDSSFLSSTQKNSEFQNKQQLPQGFKQAQRNNEDSDLFETEKSLEHLEMDLQSISTRNQDITSSDRYFCSPQSSRLAQTLQCYPNKVVCYPRPQGQDFTQSQQSLYHFSTASTISLMAKHPQSREHFNTELSEATTSASKHINLVNSNTENDNSNKNYNEIKPFSIKTTTKITNTPGNKFKTHNSVINNTQLEDNEEQKDEQNERPTTAIAQPITQLHPRTATIWKKFKERMHSHDFMDQLRENFIPSLEDIDSTSNPSKFKKPTVYRKQKSHNNLNSKNIGTHNTNSTERRENNNLKSQSAQKGFQEQNSNRKNEQIPLISPFSSLSHRNKPDNNYQASHNKTTGEESKLPKKINFLIGNEEASQVTKNIKLNISKIAAGASNSQKPGTEGNSLQNTNRKGSILVQKQAAAAAVGIAPGNTLKNPSSYLFPQSQMSAISMSQFPEFFDDHDSKHMCLAATDFKFQKQVKQKEEEIKKNRFGQEMFNGFSDEIMKFRRVNRGKMILEPAFTHYRQSEELCAETIRVIQKALVLHKSRKGLEELLLAHAKSLESKKQHPMVQLFVSLQIGKLFCEMDLPALAIPILKFVKRTAFFHTKNEYSMKAYRQLALCHISLGNLDIAFGYAAKYLHLCWSCQSASNELNAYDILGKIFYYMGDAKKSAYFHNRMADNIRETDESALKKLSIQNLKIIQSRRYEILAARDIKMQRQKYDEQVKNHNLCYVTSDDESGLNLLIPEEYLHAQQKSSKTDKQQKKFADENEDDDEDSEEDYSEKKDATDLYESNYGKEVRLSLWKYCKNDFAIRKMPRFDIKTDKKLQKETTFKANTAIGMEKRKYEQMEKYLRKPLEQFLSYQTGSSIGPMRDKLLISHKSFEKSLQVYQSAQSSNAANSETCINHLSEDHESARKAQQSEYWKDSMARTVDKFLRKILNNIRYFNMLRYQLKVEHKEKVVLGKFFEHEADPNESESDKLLRQIQQERNERQGEYYFSQIS